VEFRILGPLEVAVQGTAVTLGSAKQRALLGVLLLHANKVVSTDRLVDELWGDRPPPTSGKLIQVYVSQLRRALASAGTADVLRTRPPGYLAEVEPEQLDATHFERLLARARAYAGDGRPDEAYTVYEEALALWRGTVLADVELEWQARREADLLEELRLAALSEQTDCALALGRDSELIGRLESLTQEHPLHERFWVQLMLALYRSGRQSEALGAYHQARRTLAEQVGLDPSPELRRMEKAVLAHDPALEAAPRAKIAARSPAEEVAAPPSRRGRRMWALAAAAAVALGLACVAFLTARGGGEAPRLATISPDSVVIIDPDRNAPVDQIQLHTRPTALAYGADSLWVGAADDDTLLQIDPQTHEIRTVGLGAAPVQIAVTDDYVWVLTAQDTLVQLRSKSGSLVKRIVLPERVSVGPFAGRPFHHPYPGCFWLAADADAAWVGCWLPVALRVDARTGAVEQLPVACAGGIALGGGALWCASATLSRDLAVRPHGELSRVDPVSRKITATIDPPTVGSDSDVAGIVVRPDVLWAASTDNQALWKVDLALGRATAIVSLHHPPVFLAVDGDAVWTANRDGTISRVAASSAELVRTIPLGPYPRAAYPTEIVVGGGRVWVPVH
jgi:DNA-binding SARP family transcriptional activator